ncbi:MAG: NTP transferase domain-containing protein [Deltaproteobacteria bacterium]|nr:NTP transferase domain-containing protein [Deltaproteobacteria bacterium]
MHKKLKVAAIIQARMGSTRLPGKVLQPLAGKPLLWHLIHRLRKCRTVSVIAIATSDGSPDDPLVEFARMEGIELVRGPEDNVLQRFALAAAQLDPDVIVRVTGDAPLIDPETLDRLVETLIGEGAEYCTGEKGIDSINEGFCPFTRAALNRLLAEAAEDPVAIEHITAYFKEHPESFHIAHISISPEHQFKGARISVDTPADLCFIEELYRRLAAPPGDLEITDVVRLLRSCPELLEINRHIYQKKATDRTVRVLVRCDGDAIVGLGHVVRCLALADELREKHGCGITFAMTSGEPGMALVSEKGFPIAAKPADMSEGNWLDGLMEQLGPDILTVDVRSALPIECLRHWRKRGVLIATLDDPTVRRLEADLAFYPPVPQVRELDWSGFTGELFTGWDWVPLRRGFSYRPSASENIIPHLLVTMGGSDPAGLTLRVMQILDDLDGDFETTVVVGAGFRQGEELEALLGRTRRCFRVMQNVQEMNNLMANVDLAIASFGVTAYELAAMGVPAVYLSLTPDHARSASVFVEQGLALSCGVHYEVSDDAIASAVRSLLTDKKTCLAMSHKARTAIDGRGTERIAKTIMQRSLNQHA